MRFSYVSPRPWNPTAQDLQAFAGSYRSDQLGVTYRALVVGGTLSLSARPGGELHLQPVYPDAFTVRGSTVWFSRDRSGRVTALHVSEGRLWDLVMPRVGIGAR